MRFPSFLAGMCDESFRLLLGTLRLACVMVFCAFVLVIDAGPFSVHTWRLYRTAEELARNPAGLLLIAGIGALLLQEKSGG